MAIRGGQPAVRLAEPRIHAAQSAPVFAWLVVASLLPAAAWGIVCYGAAAATTLAVAAVAAVALEAAAALARRRFTLDDGTAALTGLLVGLSLPPGSPPWVAAAASAFAILVVKQSFGGLGANWMNPALAGRTFAMLSWGAGAGLWRLTRFASPDAVSTATPLAALAKVLASPAGPRGWPLQLLASGGYRFSGLDGSVTGWINAHLLSRIGVTMPRGIVDLLLGTRPGSIGEGPVVLLLAGAALLLALRIIRWEIPVSILGAFAALTCLFGGLRQGAGFGQGGVFFHLASGGLLLCAFFMATDPVTSPLTRWGRVAYGVGIGGLAFLLRFFGSTAEGVGVAVLLANCAVPFLDGKRHLRPARRLTP